MADDAAAAAGRWHLNDYLRCVAGGHLAAAEHCAWRPRVPAAEHLNAPAEGHAVPVSSVAALENNLYAPLSDVLSGAGMACKKGYITDNERHLLFDLVAQSVSQLLPVARACVAERSRIVTQL